MSRAGSAYIAGIITLGAVVVLYGLHDLTINPVGIEWAALLALTVVSGWATLRIPATLISFSISDTFSIAAALLFGPAAGAITAAIDGLVCSYRMSISRRTADRVLFNMAAPAIATWVAATVFFALAGSGPLLEAPGGALRLLALLTIFGVLDFALNTFIVAIAVSFERGGSVFATWHDHFLALWVTYFGGVFATMLLLILARLDTLDSIILIAPLPVLLYVTFRHALGRAQDQIGHLAKLNKVYVAAIEALAHAIDAKDQVTHDHIRRVQEEAVRLARTLGVADEGDIEAVKAAALLHDVGKLAIPEHILNKPGRLTPSEYEIMKRHAPIGADILSVIGFPYPVVPIVRHHHENWDGTGYPDGLAGEQIPIGARILAVVDCYDALTSDRPYRRKLEASAALQILAERRGTMYDPRVVDSFFDLHRGDVSPPAAPSPEAVFAVGGPSAPAPHIEAVEAAPTALLTFFELGRALADDRASLRLGEILWSHLHRHLPPSCFVLFAYDDASHALVGVHDGGAGQLGVRIPVGERLSGWVAATGQPILNSDARLDFDDDSRAKAPWRSALAVPVQSAGRVVAVLTFYACEVNAFADSHRAMVQSLAQCLGMAHSGAISAFRVEASQSQ